MSDEIVGGWFIPMAMRRHLALCDAKARLDNRLITRQQHRAMKKRIEDEFATFMPARRIAPYRPTLTRKVKDKLLKHMKETES